MDNGLRASAQGFTADQMRAWPIHCQVGALTHRTWSKCVLRALHIRRASDGPGERNVYRHPDLTGVVTAYGCDYELTEQAIMDAYWEMSKTD